MSMAKALRNQKAVRKAQAKRAKAMGLTGNYKTLEQRLETISKPMALLLCGLFCLVFWLVIIGVFFL